MGGTRWTVAVVGLTIVFAACSSSAGGRSSSTPPTSVVRVSSAAAAALTFREVLQSSSCAGGHVVTQFPRPTAAARIVLPDRKKKTCYALGPTLLTERNVGRADAAVDPTSSLWSVNVHFTNDDFVTKVAQPEVGRQVAIILDGVVESAPTVNEGITGRDVTISGNFDEATARAIAAKIDPSSASRVPETPTTTETDREMATLSQRCDAVAPRLGASPELTSASIVTAGMARTALERAHQPVPAPLAAIAADERLARCDLLPASIPDPNTTTPTTICANGDRAEVGSTPVPTMYAVDAQLNTFKLPGLQYLLPPGMTVPTTPGACAGLGG